MDKVTQQNAANAEESAAASEQMNAQAETMKDMVGELVVMVGAAQSKARRSGKAAAEEHRPGNVDNRSSRSALPARRPTARPGNGKGHQAMLPAATPAERQSGSRSTIPMEADGFSDF
jgi:methyl-accepting chemotaxis protein